MICHRCLLWWFEIQPWYACASLRHVCKSLSFHDHLTVTGKFGYTLKPKLNMRLLNKVNRWCLTKFMKSVVKKKICRNSLIILQQQSKIWIDSELFKELDDNRLCIAELNNNMSNRNCVSRRGRILGYRHSGQSVSVRKGLSFIVCSSIHEFSHNSWWSLPLSGVINLLSITVLHYPLRANHRASSVRCDF